MKKTIFFILSGAVALAMVSCAKEINETSSTDPVSIVVSMDPETKATLADDVTGAFAFSNGDAIKIYDGTAVYSGTTTSNTNTGSFSMPAEFNVNGSGLAGFPASLVSTISGSGVTFILPSSYEYSEVGGADPDAAKVSCPMIGSYTGSGSVSLKQAGSVVRFKVTNIAAGSLSFTFPTAVTGQVTLAGVSTAADGGIKANNLTLKENTIIVNNVPEVTSGNYIYITLPVPTATVPQNILVTNTPSDPSLDLRMVNLTGSSSPLSRAGGWKLAVSPSAMPTPSFLINEYDDRVIFAPGNLMAKIGTYDPVNECATATEWKFGGHYETVGPGSDAGNYLFTDSSSECVGKWVDLFCWQGSSVASDKRYHGLLNMDGSSASNATHKAWLGELKDVEIYDGCWTTGDTNSNPAPTGKIYISNGGSYKWRPLTKEELMYVLFSRVGATVGEEEHACFSRANVAGVNGLLLFPDGITWNEATMGAIPNDINGPSSAWKYADAVHYTAENMIAMANVGIVFMPVTGTRTKSADIKTYMNDNTFSNWGYYQTSTNHSSSLTNLCGDYLNFTSSQNMTIGAWNRSAGRAVRLVRAAPKP